MIGFVHLPEPAEINFCVAMSKLQLMFLLKSSTCIDLGTFLSYLDKSSVIYKIFKDNYIYLWCGELFI